MSDVTQGSVLPYRLAAELIRCSPHRIIMSGCGCRTASGCAEFPTGLGCILLGGESVGAVAAGGRRADPREALEHLSSAVELGLLPCIADRSCPPGTGRDRGLAICFCCTCCTAFRIAPAALPGDDRAPATRLPGLRILAVGDCSGCEKCARECPLGAVTVTREGTFFGAQCRGCGRCAEACPRRNIRLVFDPVEDARRALFARACCS